MKAIERVILFLVGLAAIAGLMLPAAGVTPSLGGTTNYDTLALSEDLTVADDATVSGDLAVTGTFAAGATTLTGITSITGTTTVSGQLGYKELNETTAGDNVITAAESGKTFFMGTAGEDQTLPAPAAGLTYKFVVSANFATTNMKVQGPAADATDDVIFGSVEVAGAVVLCSAEDTLTFVAETNEAIPGDWIELTSNGTNWYLSGSVATASAFTCTDVD